MHLVHRFLIRQRAKAICELVKLRQNSHLSISSHKDPMHKARFATFQTESHAVEPPTPPTAKPIKNATEARTLPPRPAPMPTSRCRPARPHVAMRAPSTSRPRRPKQPAAEKADTPGHPQATVSRPGNPKPPSDAPPPIRFPRAARCVRPKERDMECSRTRPAR